MGILSWLLGTSPGEAPNPPRQPSISLAGRGRGYCDYDIVGESFHQDELLQIAGGHRRESQHFRVIAELRPEPENEYDANAVGVYVAGLLVGHIPGKKCKAIGQQLAGFNAPTGTRFLCQAEITGGWRTNQHDEGHFGVRLDLAIPLQRG